MNSKPLAFAFLLATISAPTFGAEKASLLLSWRPETEHGGYYQAYVKGFYKDCGVDLTIREGGAGVDSAQMLVGRAVDFIMASHIDAVLHMNEAGYQARALTAAFQKTGQILMAHPESGVDSLEAMKGHPIMIGQGSRATYWPYFRARYGWDEGQLRSYSGQLAPWLSDSKAVNQGVITNEPFTVKQQAGWDPKVFLLFDAGYKTYGSILTTSQEMIDKKPQVVQCMVSATNKGWVDFMTNDPSPALKAIQTADKSNTDALMAYAVQTMRDRHLVMGDDTDRSGFGAMTSDRWKAHTDMLKEFHLLKQETDFMPALALQFQRTAAH